MPLHVVLFGQGDVLGVSAAVTHAHPGAVNSAL
jgi:hypothetical protein